MREQRRLRFEYVSFVVYLPLPCKTGIMVVPDDNVVDGFLNHRVAYFDTPPVSRKLQLCKAE